MLYDGVIPSTDRNLRKEVHKLTALGDRASLVHARAMYDEYVICRGHVTNTLALCELARLWRKLGDETRLLDAFSAIERTVDADRNHRANVRGELVLFYAMRGQHDKAARWKDEFYILRTDRMRGVMDAVINARRMMYAKQYPEAAIAMTGAAALIEGLPVVIREDVDSHSWWSFVIGVLACDEDLTETAVSWLTHGRYAQDAFIPPLDKPYRLKTIREYQGAASTPLVLEQLARMVVLAAVL